MTRNSDRLYETRFYYWLRNWLETQSKSLFKVPEKDLGNWDVKITLEFRKYID
jgi:hypothetical protein